MIRLILGQEPDLNYADKFNRMPLHHACNSGNFDAVRLLLECG